MTTYKRPALIFGNNGSDSEPSSLSDNEIGIVVGAICGCLIFIILLIILIIKGNCNYKCSKKKYKNTKIPEVISNSKIIHNTLDLDSELNSHIVVAANNPIRNECQFITRETII